MLCDLIVLIPEILVVDQNHVTALISHFDVENTLDCLVSVSLVWELYLFIKVILLGVGFQVYKKFTETKWKLLLIVK